MQSVVDYILSLGATIFVPIVLFIVGLAFRLSVLRAIKAAVTVGVGFLGLNLVVSLIGDYLSLRSNYGRTVWLKPISY